MRTLLLPLLLIGCLDTVTPQPTPATTCSDITREFWVGVPFAWDVGVEHELTITAEGCAINTTTHYVLDVDGGGVGSPGGAAPDPLQCDVDGCGGPAVLSGSKGYVDPVGSNGGEQR